MSGRLGSIIFLLIGLGLAVLAAFQIRNVLQASNTPEVVEEVVIQSVVVAAENIPIGTFLTEDLLTTKPFPIEFVDGNLFTSIDQIVDGKLTTSAPIPEGALVTTSQMANLFGLGIGYRAVTFSFNTAQSVGQNVRPGNYIDIMVAFSYTDKEILDTLQDIRNNVTDSSEIYNQEFQSDMLKQLQVIQNSTKDLEHATQIVLQNVQVLAVNSILPNSGGGIGGNEGSSEISLQSDAGFDNDIDEVFITLALLPEDVQKMFYAQQYGDNLYLSVRRQDDDIVVPVDPLSDYLKPPIEE